MQVLCHIKCLTYCVCGRQTVNVPSENVPEVQSEHSVSVAAVPVGTHMNTDTWKDMLFKSYLSLKLVPKLHCLQRSC